MYKPYTLTKWDKKAISCVNEMFQIAYTELGLGNPEAITKDNAQILLPRLFEEAYIKKNEAMPYRIIEISDRIIPVINILFEQLFL